MTADIGLFGPEICDLATTATEPTRVLVAGRKARLACLVADGCHARAPLSRRLVRFATRHADLSVDEAIAAAHPPVVVQAASVQTSTVIGGTGSPGAARRQGRARRHRGAAGADVGGVARKRRVIDGVPFGRSWAVPRSCFKR